MDPDNTASRIRTAAVDLFAEKGFAATGIRELAEAAGISSAALYHHMGTKDDLLDEIVRTANQLFLSRAERALAGRERPEERLAILVQVHVVVHANTARQSRVVDTEMRSLRPSARDEVVALRDAYEDLWRTAIDEGAAAGTFTVPDTRITRLALIEACTGVYNWFNPAGSMDIFAVAEAHVDLALAAVQARRGRRHVRAEHIDLLPPEWFEASSASATTPDLARPAG